MILAQGGSFGGWSLYTVRGRVKFAYNVCAMALAEVEADRPVPSGKHQVRMEFAYDGGGLAKGGTVSLFYDGEKVGEGRVERTIPFIFSADETVKVGCDSGTPVAPDYEQRDGVFNGDIHWVQITTGSNEADRLIEPEERVRIAMARQ